MTNILDSSIFPAPKTQDLSRLGMMIRKFDNVYVENVIKTNPRLLASATDGPTILQEGYRYNALHVAASCGNTEALRLILSRISGLSFMKSLYPDDPPNIRQKRIKYLSDMYLNTPERGFLETPLHFACKFNHLDIVRILLGHPLCDMNLRNGEQKTALDIIGTRSRTRDENTKVQIKRLFEETCIVPIWRDLKNESAPIVGRPVNPKYLGQYTPISFRAPYGDIPLEHFGPVDLSCVPKWPFGSRPEVRAYAGPIDEETATLFYSTIKGTVSSTHGGCSPSGSPRVLFPSNHGDTTELIPNGRQLPSSVQAEQSSTPLRTTPERHKSSEGFPTPPRSRARNGTRLSGLLSPADYEYTPKTLSRLLSTSPAGSSTPQRILEDRQIRRKDSEKGLERVARKYAAELALPWHEYWDFLGDFTNLSSEAGLVLLENHLRRKSGLEWERQIKSNSSISTICQELENLNLKTSNYAKSENAEEAIYVSNLSEIRCYLRESSKFLPNAATLTSNGISHSVKKIEKVIPENPCPLFEVQKLSPTLSSSLSNGVEIEKTEYLEFKNSWRNPNRSVSMHSWSSSSSLDLEDEYCEEENCGNFEECYTIGIFLNGTEPTKEDYHAMRAMEMLMEGMLDTNFPLTIGWFNQLKATAIMK